MKTFTHITSISTTILMLLAFTACNNNKENSSLNTDLIKNPISADGNTSQELPDVKFETDKFDFGTLQQGEKKTTIFKFTNTGNSDLIIQDAKGSCGCTVPDFPKEPVKPGNSGIIKVTFNSEGKSGIQNKSVTLITNCIPSTKFLAIKANVVTNK